MKCSQKILDLEKIQDQAIRIWEWTMQLLQFLHRRNLHPKDVKNVSWFPQFLYMEKHYVLIKSCLVAGVTQLEEYSDLL